MRDDILSSLNSILKGLVRKKELILKIYYIEKKIADILEHSREDDIFELITDETDIIEQINLLDYDISMSRDYIKNKTGFHIEEILSKKSEPEELKDNIRKTVIHTEDIIFSLSELKKKNLALLVSYSGELAIQIRELEIMNSITIIPPKDLQSP